jgi:hypothetical protein
MSEQGSPKTRALLSARAKLWWASQNLESLNNTVGSSLKGDGATFIAERESASRYVIRLDTTNIPTSLWALILGDAVHGFRGALDHAAWQAVLHGKGIPESEREQNRIQFPIYDRPEAFDNATLLSYVGDECRAVFREAQEYDRTEDARRLRILAALSNDDKHRLLIPSVLSLAPEDIQLRVGHNEDIVSIGEFVGIIRAGERLEGQAVIGYIPDVVVTGANPDMQVEGNLSAFVAFEGRGAVTPRISDLAGIGLYVKEIIQQVEALFDRRGIA